MVFYCHPSRRFLLLLLLLLLLRVGFLLYGNSVCDLRTAADSLSSGPFYCITCLNVVGLPIQGVTSLPLYLYPLPLLEMCADRQGKPSSQAGNRGGSVREAHTTRGCTTVDTGRHGRSETGQM